MVPIREDVTLLFDDVAALVLIPLVVIFLVPAYVDSLVGSLRSTSEDVIRFLGERQMTFLALKIDEIAPCHLLMSSLIRVEELTTPAIVPTSRHRNLICEIAAVNSHLLLDLERDFAVIAVLIIFLFVQ